MDETAKLSLEEAIAQEEARLRERLSDLAEFKRLAAKLNMPVPGLSVSDLVKPSAPPALEPQVVVPKVLEGIDFDGTISALIYCYKNDPRSSFHNLKHTAKSHYTGTLNRLDAEIGTERIADLNAVRIQHLYNTSWAVDGKLAMGHAMVAKLRLLSSYGSVALDDDDCTRLSAILGNMRFQIPKFRGERMTLEHAKAIIEAARSSKLNSIAIAQAFQFEIPELRNMDVIGEWVPLSEPGTSEIVKGDKKWLRGLRWSEIDDNLILRRTITSGRENQHREIVKDLRTLPLVRDQIEKWPWMRGGPVVVCEHTGLPWMPAAFRPKWREIADKAGVPSAVKYSDSGRSDSTEGDTDLRADAL